MNEQRDARPVLRYFVSYQRKDDGKLKQDLMKRLTARLNNAKDYRFEMWEDGEIDAGEPWHEKIQQAIAGCDFGLLLVSPYFLVSEYIGKQELPAYIPATPDQVDSAKRAIPVALRPIDFSGNSDLKGLAQLQVFRYESRAFSERTADNARESFADALYQQILRIAKKYVESTRYALSIAGEGSERDAAQLHGRNDSPTGSISLDFLAKARARITELLQNSAAETLRKNLSTTFSTDGNSLPAELLVPVDEHFSLEESVNKLHDAAKHARQTIATERSNQLEDFVKVSESIMGWLLVLAVSENRIALGKTELIEDLNAVDLIEIPVTTEAGLEIVSARLRRHEARVDMDSSLKIYGRDRLDYGEVELGLTNKDALNEVMKMVWLKVMKSPPPDTGNWKARLDSTLRLRRKRGDGNYYISIPGDRAGKANSHKDMLRQLQKELPCLNVFVIGQGAADWLVIPESDVEALISEFFVQALGKFQ